MNLLPQDHKEFASEDYWNEFFSKQKSQHFEWYGEYDSLSEVLNKYIRPKDRILNVGCGSSKLTTQLYDVGICNSVNIDVSGRVINQMKAKYGKDRPKMSYQVMNVFELSYEDGTFTVVIDKGTLDAILVDTSKEVMDKVDKMLSQIDRVLHNFGRYLCFSLLQEHVLNKLLDWFTEKGWLMRFHRCIDAEAKHTDSLVFPIYAIVMTKIKKIPSAAMVLEIVHNDISAPKRCSTKSDVIDYVKNAQHYAFLKHYLTKRKAVDDDICLELCSADTGEVKYRMFVVDREEESAVKVALFIVPQGREIEWLFSTPPGRLELASNADCERLVVVHLLRDNVYTSLDEVKDDLSSKVWELTPSSCRAQIPILSLGNDVGRREIKFKGRSEISGEFVVEDVLSSNEDVCRRLIFLSNPYLVQSEVKIGKKKKGSAKNLIDLDYLACDHHVAIISGLAFLKYKMLCPTVLIIGLGGGALAIYLHKHFPDANIEVVELDPCILDVAKNWFDLVTDERLKIYISDGITFIHDAVQKGLKYDAVILDVDNKDATLGISSPPVTFFEEAVLQNLSQLVYESGVVIMNLACRSAQLQAEAYCKVKSVFKLIFNRKIPNQVNEVIYCISSNQSSSDILNQTKDNYESFVAFLEKRAAYSDMFDLVDLESCITQIT